MLSESPNSGAGGIKIWLSQPQFMAGDVVTGSVLLDVGSMPADSLTLFLKGVDEITTWKRHQKKNRRYMKREVQSNQFARVKLQLTTFPERKIPAGKTAYPFQMSLPVDLPPSITCKSD